MADKDKGGAGSFLDGKMLVALLAVAGGAFYLVKEAPLESVRPATQETAYRGYAYHDVEARLWQDPFGAVEEKRQELRKSRAGEGECSPPGAAPEAAAKRPARNNNSSSSDKVAQLAPSMSASQRDRHCDALKKEIADEIARAPVSPSSVSTLAALVDGSPYAENVEFRRRTRYAILAGLHEQGFESEDPEHLDYFRPAKGGGAERLGAAPYEWFRRPVSASSKENTTSVLVLWVDETALFDASNRFGPLKGLHSLFSEIGLFGVSRIVVLGPHTSTTRLEMEKEKPKWRPPLVQSFPVTPFYTYSATISDKALCEKLDVLEERCAARLKFPPEISRKIADDGVLADAIVEELRLRHFKFPDDGSIALVSEWDTLYGRTIMSMVQEAFKTKAREHPAPGSKVEDADLDPKFVKVGYLRGIDGQRAPDAKSASDKSKEKNGGGAKSSEGLVEQSEARARDRPHGSAQNDYLRRLADRLAQMDKDLRVKGERGIKAVGVLGNDVFDKLLVLRALKPKLPGAIFFTTDYDAALTMPEELNFTRNLIVASGFGPFLDKPRRQSVPPFRSVYQTAAFSAAQLAVAGGGGATPHEAQIFEISRNGDMKERPAHSPAAIPLFPKFEPSQQFFFALASVFGVIIFFGATYYLHRTASTQEGTVAWKDTRFVGFLLLACALLVGGWEWVAPSLTEHGGGEPIALVDGLSVWPTIAIRLLVIAVSFHFVARAKSALARNLVEIHEDMYLGRPAEIIDAMSKGNISNSIERKAKNIFQYMLTILTPRITTFYAKAKNEPYLIAAAWKNYIYQGRSDARSFRSATAAAAVTVIFLVAYQSNILESVFPVIRGNIAYWAFVVTLFVEIFLVAYVTFYVVDATLFCLTFVNDFEYHETKWPERPASTQRQGDASTADAQQALGVLNSAGGAQRKETFEHKLEVVRNDIKDLDFIEKHTTVLLPLIYSPFFIIALMIVARSRVFAAYPQSAIVLASEALALGALCLCAIFLDRAAEHARSLARERIVSAIIESKTLGDAERKTADFLEPLLRKVDGLDGGAFMPIWRQPLVAGLILPISGVIVTKLLDLNWWPF